MHSRSTLSATAMELMRRALAVPAADPAGSGISISERTGLPSVRAARAISANDVHALEDWPGSRPLQRLKCFGF